MVKLREIFVSSHAPAISSLLFETARSPHDQKGLLIGEIATETVTIKTDDETTTEERTNIYLEHIAPLEETDVFGNLGDVNKDKLQKYINHYSNKIVGWYTFRRNTHIGFRTLKEFLTHKSLVDSIPSVELDQFLAAFVSTSTEPHLATHTTNYIFMRYNPENFTFEPVNFKINTLSDTIKGHVGCSTGRAFPTSIIFENIINPNHERSNSLLSILSINRTVCEHLKFMGKKLAESEKIKAELEEEVKNLKKCLAINESSEVRINEEAPEPEFEIAVYNPGMNYNPGRQINPMASLAPRQEKKAAKPPRHMKKRKSVAAATERRPPRPPKARKVVPSNTARPRSKTEQTGTRPRKTGGQPVRLYGGVVLPKVNPPPQGEGSQSQKPTPPLTKPKDKQEGSQQLLNPFYNFAKSHP